MVFSCRYRYLTFGNFILCVRVGVFVGFMELGGIETYLLSLQLS